VPSAKINASCPVLPDGILSNQKSPFGLILKGLAMQDVGISNAHFVYFTANGYLVHFVVMWYIFSRFGI
jgi:hypothetical protein